MGAIADLIKKVPAAAKYRAALEAIERENVQLRAENEELKEELAQYIQQWETLDGDAVTTLVYLSQYERGHSHEIAATNKVTPQTVEAYLKFLAQHAYVHPPADGAAGYGIAHKGRRYLSERGLLKPPKAKAKSGTARARAAPPARKPRKRR
jgi:cell division septum initiation protein DivIVA